ncbi:MAG: NAD-dependent epimerase/dehydratase family protein [Anaerolineae bacterium]
MEPVDLVTGASGLLGGNLVRVLAGQGARVRILVRRNSRIEHLADLPAIEKAEGDVTVPASLERAMVGVRYVYHCAARVTIARRMTDAVWQTNVWGTMNVLQAARTAGIRRLVYCSTVDALGLPEDGRPADEQTPWNWDRLGVENAYARSKYEAHQAVLGAAASGLDVVIACPTYMLGAYDVRPSSGRLIITCAKSHLLPRVTGGNNFVDVLDVTEGMIAMAERGLVGEAYILGNANLPYTEVYGMIAAAIGRRVTVVPLPFSLALLAGRAADVLARGNGRDAGLNSALVRLSYLRHYYDPAKAVRELGLPQRPVAGAIERAVAWFRQVGMLPTS